MSTNGTNIRRTAQPGQPRSWNLDTAALRITTAAKMTQSACDIGCVRPTSIAVFVKVATIPSRMPKLRIDAANQKINSSLPIRLDIGFTQPCRKGRQPYRRKLQTICFFVWISTNHVNIPAFDKNRFDGFVASRQSTPDKSDCRQLTHYPKRSSTGCRPKRTNSNRDPIFSGNAATPTPV